MAIIDQGRIVRQGTPAALKAEIEADVIDLAVEDREAGAAQAAITELQAGLTTCPRASCAAPGTATPVRPRRAARTSPC